MTGQQLKNSILQLAIEGRLVAQCPTDEPASALLQRIRQEKQALVKAGTLKKKDLTSTPITDDEKPFDIPESWEWCRLYDVVSPDCTLSYGIVQPMNDVPGGVPVVRPVDMNVSIVRKQGLKRVDKGISDCYQRTILKGGEILFCVRGTVGKISLASKELEGCNVTRGISPIRFNDEDVQCFIYYVLMSPLSRTEIEGYSKGAALRQINIEDLKKLLIPLPPLAEQRRIVARIEELMPLVEQYGKAQGELEALNAGLPEALKKSILQEAIQGRLVPQCATDEPASALLQRIRREKEQLVKAGTLKKKDLTTTPITDDEKPFDIPEGWEWCRLGELMRVIGGTSYSKSDIVPRGIRILRGGNIQATKLCLFDDDVYVSETLLDSEKNIMDGDTIIVASTGSFTAIGKPAFINGSYPCTQIGAFLRILRPYNLMLAPYIRLIFMGDYYRSHLLSKVKGTNINNIKAAYIEDMPIPLPPLAEQRRIVAKIEELFALL